LTDLNHAGLAVYVITALRKHSFSFFTNGWDKIEQGMQDLLFFCASLALALFSISEQIVISQKVFPENSKFT
jgi:hypothetical protein